jgi:Protein of unknown function (DUF3617)
MKNIGKTAFLLLALCAQVSFAQTMAPGEWEFTTTATSAALPAPQVTTQTQCVSGEDAADPTRFSGTGAAEGCKVTPGSRSTDAYDWTVSCPAQGISGEGRVRFAVNSIDSESRVTADLQGQKIEMTSRTTGRLLGPCKPK